MKPTDPSTTAARLLSLVFEGHQIRTVMSYGQPLFVATDVAAACGISAPRDVVKTHVDADQLLSISLDTRSANGVLQKRSLNCVTQSGVFALVMGSRKPAARRFSRWLMDEVIPQLIKYGSYLPGATAAERLRALGLRYRAERAQQMALDAAVLAGSELCTLRQFVAAHGIPARRVLVLCSRLAVLSRTAGSEPVKLTLPGRKHNPTNAWPRELLTAAHRAVCLQVSTSQILTANQNAKS